jgi:UDP-3-O-[3-hydroxymyristoyl] glucosamine N-acyltransferase
VAQETFSSPANLSNQILMVNRSFLVCLASVSKVAATPDADGGAAVAVGSGVSVGRDVEVGNGVSVGIGVLVGSGVFVGASVGSGVSVRTSLDKPGKLK